jgi:hypothetical protein
MPGATPKSILKQIKNIEIMQYLAGQPCRWHTNCRSFEPDAKKTPGINIYLDFSKRT